MLAGYGLASKREGCMTYRFAVSMLVVLATAPAVHAASLAGGTLSANAVAARAYEPVIAVKWRHSGAAALLTCRKIRDREERERCLGHMEHPYGVPPKPKR
jgi:hypothetical protein